MSKQLISVVVPVYNEAGSLPQLYTEIKKVFGGLQYRHEIIFVDDGSSDDSLKVISQLEDDDPSVKVVGLVRNFGKEVATTAGLHACEGEAAIMLDADLQHPPKLIPEFIERWERGAELVIGVRRRHAGDSILKRFHSWLFYKIINGISETKVTPSATDFRLLDRVVVDEFNRFTERNRITRGLIDWLGFRREYIYFDAGERVSGKAAYGIVKLIRLALHSFVSLSLLPLRLAGYLGILITLVSGTMGLFIFIEKYQLHDPLKLRISGPASLATVNMFLIGIVLMSLGLIALYIANIHGEVVNRPLYVARRRPQRPNRSRTVKR